LAVKTHPGGPSQKHHFSTTDLPRHAPKIYLYESESFIVITVPKQIMFASAKTAEIVHFYNKWQCSKYDFLENI